MDKLDKAKEKALEKASKPFNDFLVLFKQSVSLSLSSAATALVVSNVILQPTLSFVTTATSKLSEFFSSIFISRLHVAQKDEAFQWIMYYLSQHEYTIKKTNQLSVLTHTKLKDMVTQHSSAAAEKEKHKAPLHFVPAPGTHAIKFENKTIYITYSNITSTKDNNSTTTTTTTTQAELTLSSYSLSAQILKRFLNFTQDYFIKSQMGKTLIYVPDTFCDIWEARISRQKRAPKTVILPNNQFEELLNDAKEFLSQQEFYEERGCPFRRGYLIYGPPGVGKTSTILAIAGALDLNICMLNLANKNLGDEKLTNLLLNAPPSSIILLEDVDHAIYHSMQHQRRAEDAISEESSGEDSVSLSGLLNSIDGVIAQEGKVIFMTTNHVERLPEALIRPGRIDVTKYMYVCLTLML